MSEPVWEICKSKVMNYEFFNPFFIPANRDKQTGSFGPTDKEIAYKY